MSNALCCFSDSRQKEMMAYTFSCFITLFILHKCFNPEALGCYVVALTPMVECQMLLVLGNLLSSMDVHVFSGSC